MLGSEGSVPGGIQAETTWGTGGASAEGILHWVEQGSKDSNFEVILGSSLSLMPTSNPRPHHLGSTF